MSRTREAFNSLFSTSEDSTTQKKFGSFAATEQLEKAVKLNNNNKEEKPSIISKIFNSVTDSILNCSTRTKIIIATTGLTATALGFLGRHLAEEEKKKWNRLFFLAESSSNHTATDNSTKNIAEEWFLQKCDQQLQEYIKTHPNYFIVKTIYDRFANSSSSSGGERMWLKLALWSRFVEEQQKKKNNNTFMTVVILSEHTQLPSTSAASHSSARIVEVALPVRGEISAHVFSMINNNNKNQMIKKNKHTIADLVSSPSALAQPQGSSFDPLASISSQQQQQPSSPQSVVASFNNAVCEEEQKEMNNSIARTIYLRLMFQRKSSSSGSSTSTNPLHKLHFAEGSSTGKYADNEDPQDLKVVLMKNTNQESIKNDDVTPKNQQLSHYHLERLDQQIAHYECESQEDDVGFPLISVDKNAKVEILPSTKKSAGFDENNTTSRTKEKEEEQEQNAFIPHDVLIQKTFLHRNLSLTIFRALTKSFGGLADFINNGVHLNSNNNKVTSKLHSLFIVVSASSGARCGVRSAFSNNRHVPHISASSKIYQTVVDKVETHQHQRQNISRRGNKNGKKSNNKNASSTVFEDNNKKHFVFSLLSSSTSAARNLERTTSDPNKSEETASYSSSSSNTHHQKQQRKNENDDDQDDNSNDEDDLMFVSEKNDSVPFTQDELARADSKSNSTNLPRMFRFNADFIFEQRDFVPRAFADDEQSARDLNDDDDFSLMKKQNQDQAKRNEKRNAYLMANSSSNMNNGNQTMLKVTLCWSVLGESSSGIHLKRCRSKIVDGIFSSTASSQQQLFDEDQENIRVLRESWYTMDVPVSY